MRNFSSSSSSNQKSKHKSKSKEPSYAPNRLLQHHTSEQNDLHNDYSDEYDRYDNVSEIKKQDIPIKNKNIGMSWPNGQGIGLAVV